MADRDDPFDQVVAVIGRYLSGELTFDGAIEVMTPALRAMAEQQARLWGAFEPQPGSPVRLKKLSVADWQAANVGSGPVVKAGTPSFAPGRSREEEEKARALFTEACRRVFGMGPDAA